MYRETEFRRPSLILEYERQTPTTRRPRGKLTQLSNSICQISRSAVRFQMDIPRDNLFLSLSVVRRRRGKADIFFQLHLLVYVATCVEREKDTRKREREREERGTKFMYRLVCNEVNRGRNLH